MRRVGSLALCAMLVGGYCATVAAHAGARLTDPLEGATLGETPSAVRLSFTEKPEPSLSAIHVLDTAGQAYHIGQAAAVDGDPLALAVRVKPLARGVYIVEWRTVSAIDGHVTTGSYAFGVRMSPTGVSAGASQFPRASNLEIASRWTFLTGLVLLLGAVAAMIGKFGGSSDVSLAAGGWLLAMIGSLLMADAQRRTTGAPFAALLHASIGRALLWRAGSIFAAGIAVIVVWWTERPSRAALRFVALAAVAIATLTAVASHAIAGHAAARTDGLAPTLIAVQWAHVAAAGVWMGGLAALLLGVRGLESAEKAAAVRRFSTVAAIGLAVVTATGAVRTFDSIASPSELRSTVYGRVLLAKIVLLVAIAALGALNRWRNVGQAATRLVPIRRTGAGELLLAVVALAAAAILATLPPPAAAFGMRGLDVAGADFATSVRARLRAVSDQPGPNRFIVSLADYDSRTPLHPKRVSLRFTPIDDPGVPPTSLTLAPGPDDTYQASGANLTFDGRWQVTVLVEREADSVGVPLAIETKPSGRSPIVTIARPPDQPPVYMVDVPGGTLRISPDPEHVGPSQLSVSFGDLIGDPRRVDAVVVTTSSGGAVRQAPLRPTGRSQFAATINLQRGRNEIAVVARGHDGTRIRSVFEVRVAR